MNATAPDIALNKLSRREPFTTRDLNGVWQVAVKEYLPLVCTVLHDNASFPYALEEHCLLTADERRYEEDPHTLKLVESLPIVISAQDSRYFYDLNRPPEWCNKPVVFGRAIWKDGSHPLLHEAQQRHAQFYLLLKGVIDRLLTDSGTCMIIDIHSYNYSRIARPTPLFNLGSIYTEKGTNRPTIECFKSALGKVKLSGEETTVAENDVFSGYGYLAQWVSENYPNCLTLPLEVKKVFCDEVTGQENAIVLRTLAQGIKQATEEAFQEFSLQTRSERYTA